MSENAPAWDEVVEQTSGSGEPDSDTDIIISEVVEGEVVDVVPEMSEDDARKITGWIKSSTEMLSVLLFQAREGKAWKALGYDDWDAYCVEEFGFTGSTGYRKAIHGEVVTAIEGHVPEGTEVKLSQKDAADIRELLPQITESLDNAAAAVDGSEDGEIDIDSIINDALDSARSNSSSDDDNAADADANSDIDIDELLKSISDDVPVPTLGDNAASGLDSGSGSIGEARKNAASQHRSDAAGAPDFDASSLTPEDLAAIKGGASLTPANSVRSFVTWNDRLPDPVEAARVFKEDSIDDEFVSELPDKLKGVRNWIDRFLKEFSSVSETVPSSDDSEDGLSDLVIEEIDDDED